MPTPDLKILMKAAMNIEMALMNLPRFTFKKAEDEGQQRKIKKPLSPKEERFRNALGVRLKIDKQDQGKES